ncbi:MAG: hypothetical protein WBA93_28090 [Microcoleaceae cyanobacterium]
MSSKKQNSSNKSSDEIQLELFDVSSYSYLQTKSKLDSTKTWENDNLQKQSSPNVSHKQKKDETTDELDANQTISKKKTQIDKLILPLTYEDIVKKLGKTERARMAELIVPVTEFEELIIQIINDIDISGYLLFLYGTSGVGKSTFVSSLAWRKHIPIKQILPINTTELPDSENSGTKLKNLHRSVREKSEEFFNENNRDGEKLCIVIDYLENLQGEDEEKVRAFFRDLNGLLRQYPILIIWPVTERQDLEKMQAFAKSFSSSMFHRRIPVIDFTGPPLQDYPSIAKKTISFFNEGRSFYDFQLNDEDLTKFKQEYEQKPKEKHIIRDYLKEIIYCWEERTNYIAKVSQTVPRPTEVWFIFSYPEAENVVARFAKQSPDLVEETWNADYKALSPYISSNNQRKADWPSERLALALNGILTTKIMYLPTNALISCIVAYAEEANIPISKDDFLDGDNYCVPKTWFGKKYAQDRLSSTPLYLQLLNRRITTGNRKSGTVQKALESARKAFEKLNKDISTNKNFSDKRLNQALFLALSKAFETQDNISFSCEKRHPFIQTIQPDILVDVHNERYICLELCYTIDKTPSTIADYVLRKLNVYMKQLQEKLGGFQDFP